MEMAGRVTGLGVPALEAGSARARGTIVQRRFVMVPRQGVREILILADLVCFIVRENI